MILIHFMLKKTGDHHLSQDLLQTTFVIAYRKLHRFNPKYAFSTWIYTIANRQAINHFRRQRPFDSKDADRVVEETPDTEMLAAEQQSRRGVLFFLHRAQNRLGAGAFHRRLSSRWECAATLPSVARRGRHHPIARPWQGGCQGGGARQSTGQGQS